MFTISGASALNCQLNFQPISSLPAAEPVLSETLAEPVFTARIDASLEPRETKETQVGLNDENQNKAGRPVCKHPLTGDQSLAREDHT